jgi:NAD(P)-dependent dehydrogenase (short-subunit alcohol dehydrogenase family)
MSIVHGEQTVRHVVVTGAGEGIGRAIALHFLRQGADVHGLDRNAKALRQVAESAAGDSAPKGRFVPYHVDLADRGETDRAARLLLDALEGRCDTLVNNAGMGNVRPFSETDDSVLDALFAVNFIAAFRLTRGLLPAIRASRGGSVVNIASELALFGQSGYSAYSATKGAILAWSRTLAVELAPLGIRVNAVCPGPVETSLLAGDFAAAPDPLGARSAEIASVPLGRLGLPTDISEVVAFLASDAAAFVTGVAWPVDGGKTAGGSWDNRVLDRDHGQH